MTSKTKKWSSAPLPFQGQKRKFTDAFRGVLKLYPHCDTIVDLFGGSGLLARISKDERPDARVIFNDYDDFSKRVANIPNTNRLLHAFRDVLRDVKKNALLPDSKKAEILSIIEKESGYVDYVSVSSSILFSMKYKNTLDGLKASSFYNRVRISDYDLADDYLNGLEIVKGDYKDIFRRFNGDKNVLWLVDPPYLSTDCTTYKKSSYWNLKDYLDVLNVLQDTNFVYFTSDKSSIVELCEWLGEKSPFSGAKKIVVEEIMNYTTSYKDMMFYKTREEI